MANPPSVTFYFDYVDPGSYLLEKQLARVLPDDIVVIHHPFELRPVSQPILDAESPEWVTYCEAVGKLADEIDLRLACPPFLPWSRKAHELRLHAVEQGMGAGVHEALLKARFEEGADVGRIDVLVGIADGAGLDVTESKAVLDVDRHAGTVSDLRHRAEMAGISRTPTLRIGAASLEGPARIDDLRGFLEGALPV